MDTKNKESILAVMHAIAEKELDREASSLQTATYNDQKQLISALFNSVKYNTGSIMLRLVVIDSLYSTNAAYSYFSFEEMADKIYNLLGGTEEGARRYFYDIACGTGYDKYNLFQEPFGIQKNLSEGSKQMSLLSKYAYYTLYSDKETRKQYPLGFPIYDSLALESYPTVCKMLGIEQRTGIVDNIEDYVKALNDVREHLFLDNGLFNGKYQQFDILDAYLWRMGKFNGGNLSLLLGRKDYVKFVNNLGLNAEHAEGEEDKFYEKDEAYKQRMKNVVSVEKGFHCPVDKNGKSQFDFNAAVVELYTKENCNPFKDTSNEEYLCQLLAHWRLFNQEKKKTAKYYRYSKASGTSQTIADLHGYDFETLEKKNTKLQNNKSMSYKKSAISGEYMLGVLESGSIEVYRVYDNVKGALREIAEKEGFKYDPEWNTRQFGSKLVDFLNSK